MKECSWVICTKTSVSPSHSKSLSKRCVVRNKKEQQNKPLCDSNIPKRSLKHPPLGHKTAFFNSVCCTMKHMRSFLSQALWIETGIFYMVFFSYPPFLPPLKTTPSPPVQEGSLSGSFLPMIPIALEGTWWPRQLCRVICQLTWKQLDHLLLPPCRVSSSNSGRFRSGRNNRCHYPLKPKFYVKEENWMIHCRYLWQLDAACKNTKEQWLKGMQTATWWSGVHSTKSAVSAFLNRKQLLSGDTFSSQSSRSTRQDSDPVISQCLVSETWSYYFLVFCAWIWKFHRFSK